MRRRRRKRGTRDRAEALDDDSSGPIERRSNFDSLLPRVPRSTRLCCSLSLAQSCTISIALVIDGLRLDRSFRRKTRERDKPEPQRKGASRIEARRGGRNLLMEEKLLPFPPNSHHIVRLGGRGHQRRVVRDAKVAPEPDDGDLVLPAAAAVALLLRLRGCRVRRNRRHRCRCRRRRCRCSSSGQHRCRCRCSSCSVAAAFRDPALKGRRRHGLSASWLGARLAGERRGGREREREREARVSELRVFAH